MIFVCGLGFWLLAAIDGHGLRTAQGPVPRNALGLLTSIYFSFVTATSVGYGDVVPVGLTRLLAILEAVTAMLLFGAVVSKFVSGRQERLVAEIHRLTFEERIERVQANLHAVISDLSLLIEACSDETRDRARLASRVESVARLFLGELRTTHALLYRPELDLDEQRLEAILVELSTALEALSDLLACTAAPRRRSPQLEANLRSIAALADEICGTCVPHDHPPALKVWMDKIQALAKRVA